MLFIALGTLCWLGTASSIAAEQAARALPHCALAVGQELRYVIGSGIWFEGTDGKPRIRRKADGTPKYEEHSLTLYVLSRNTDNSYRVVFQTTSIAGYPVLSYADLSPNGRIAWDRGSKPVLESDTLRTVFPLLPPNQRAQKEGWEEIDDRSELRTHYQLVGDEIQAVCQGPLDRVAGGSKSTRYWIDPTNNLPGRVYAHGYWASYKETDDLTVTFKEMELHGAGWAEHFSAEAERYFEAAAQYRYLCGRNNAFSLAVSAQSQTGADKVLDRARSVLTATRENLREAVFCLQLEWMLKEFDKCRKNRVATALRYARIAGLQAPPWKATDLEGREHALEQYHGRVVVLDFWFRRCSFCMRVMPQLEQVAACCRRSNAPVTFLGMSADKDESDARHVARELKLAYPVLNATEVAQTYGIDFFPTVLVIDAQGKIQGIFEGCSPTLREDLHFCIDECLAMDRGAARRKETMPRPALEWRCGRKREL
jgi:peroxiredoxin